MQPVHGRILIGHIGVGWHGRRMPSRCCDRTQIRTILCMSPRRAYKCRCPSRKCVRGSPRSMSCGSSGKSGSDGHFTGAGDPVKMAQCTRPSYPMDSPICSSRSGFPSRLPHMRIAGHTNAVGEGIWVARASSCVLCNGELDMRSSFGQRPTSSMTREACAMRLSTGQDSHWTELRSSASMQDQSMWPGS